MQLDCFVLHVHSRKHTCMFACCDFENNGDCANTSVFACPRWFFVSSKNGKCANAFLHVQVLFVVRKTGHCANTLLHVQVVLLCNNERTLRKHILAHVPMTNVEWCWGLGLLGWDGVGPLFVAPGSSKPERVAIASPVDVIKSIRKMLKDVTSAMWRCIDVAAAACTSVHWVPTNGSLSHHADTHHH